MKISCTLLYSVSLLALLAFLDVAYALNFPVRGYIATSSRGELGRRENIFGVSTLNNSGNIAYYTNVSLGGQTFLFGIDTGSSDFWVEGSVANSTDLGLVATVTYAQGSAAGPVKRAEMIFAGYTVDDQVFMEVTHGNNTSNFPGIIGLGPNSGSLLLDELDGTDAGDAPLDRIFKQNLSTPNYITTLLGRANDPADGFPGDMTVGEILPGYEDVLNQPKLNVTVLSQYLTDINQQHWQTLLDEDGFAVNGRVVALPDTVVNGTENKRQATYVLDTGFSLSQVPAAMASAIYAEMPGSALDEEYGIYTVPCDVEVNVTYTFAGRVIPLHPLDLIWPLFNNGSNAPLAEAEACYGTFQPIALDTVLFDGILGMSFLRNVYALINFGDFVDDAPASRADPYIQLLATTNDTAEAHLDFVNAVAGVALASSGSVTKALLANSTMSIPEPSPTTSEHARRRKKASAVARYVLIAVLLVVGAVLLVAGIVWRKLRATRQAKQSRTGGSLSAPTYAPVGVPAPDAAHDVHQVPYDAYDGKVLVMPRDARRAAYPDPYDSYTNASDSQPYDPAARQAAQYNASGPNAFGAPMSRRG